MVTTSQVQARVESDRIRDEEAAKLETEIRILDCVRWALKDHPERAWEVISKIIEGRAKRLNSLLGPGAR